MGAIANGSVLLAGTGTNALESRAILSTTESVWEEIDSLLLSTWLPVLVRKEESHKISVGPESRTAVTGDLEELNDDI